ncbi:hypothetical protein A9996_13615 [Gelidibacter algens]|jgi:hypothetical protein|nr:hypothetical protein A9996_13615 [Gelidibacter algens]
MSVTTVAQGIAVASLLLFLQQKDPPERTGRYNGKPGLCAQKGIITTTHPTITKTNVKRTRIAKIFD